MSAAPGVPGQGWYLAAGGAAASGVAVAIALIGWLIFSSDERTQFAVPGRAAVELRAGGHLVWDDYQTTFEGSRYDLPPLPAASADIRVQGPDGTQLATRPAPSHTFTDRKTARRALIAFHVVQPGSHQFAVGGAFQPRVFSVAPDRVLRPFIATFGAMAAVVLGLGAGFALWAWAFFRRDAAAQAAAPQGAAAPDAADAPLRKLAAIVYALQLAGYFTGVSPIAGVIINYVKRDAVAGTWLESHFRWQIRTFWITLAGTVAGLALLVAVVGIFILGVTAMWFLYRAIKGAMELSAGRPMYGP
jgi:uncharacterized membrane protein